MEIKRVCALYFSPTGNTERVVVALADTLAEQWGVPWVRMPFTSKVEREKELSFTDTDFAVIGFPTYAGKLPNKLLPELKARLRGTHTPAAAIVTFGNRSYDNALAELCAVLKGNGLYAVAGGAFVGCHAFSGALAGSRPNQKDIQDVKKLAAAIYDKVKRMTELSTPVTVPGEADAPYYVPKGTDGQPVKFLAAKPKTDSDRCVHCGVCAGLCPMGAIDLEDVFRVPGTCIKCHACVRNCTQHAKYFDDPAFLSHVAMLEQTFQLPRQNEVFL